MVLSFLVPDRDSEAERNRRQRKHGVNSVCRVKHKRPRVYSVAVIHGRAEHRDGGFQPELAKMLVSTLGKHPDAVAPLPFADATGHWAAREGYLQTAVAIKAISGFPDGTFRPDDPVTRSQIIKMAAAAAGLVADGSPPYADIREQDWFTGWVAAAHRAVCANVKAALRQVSCMCELTIEDNGSH